MDERFDSPFPEIFDRLCRSGLDRPGFDLAHAGSDERCAIGHLNRSVLMDATKWIVSMMWSIRSL
ncbi:MAG TPA: hypothetical protein VGI17_16650 [Solirubrobacterales bacterium]